MNSAFTEYRSAKTWPYHISAGGAVYQTDGKKRLYAVLYRGQAWGEAGQSWHLPKGTLSRAETLEQAAKREIKEESGLIVEIEAYLGSVHDIWQSPKHHHLVDKTTHYFLCRRLSGDEQDIDTEHERVDWLTPEDAIEKLARMPKQEANIIKHAEDWFRQKEVK